ncbi:PEGA domain-containing protein [Bacteriovorax sp. Seq25_V]|uniref:PEGA domain-containing protein n=1 Tax=Bacteriovorax sp. Seq25_V TaxID=1201288 RepID=UPI000389EF0B|nr:PEGA domain-containing protein [Bacteriovorax sp. Seq25_V]EQC43854.1 PEGA domain protein [Bacteriovorax sp. Seq25_V]
MLKKISAAVIALVIFTGCAGVIKGTSQTVTFTSEPSGAEVIIDGTSRGMTPLTVKLKKNMYDTIIIKKDGYNSVTKPLEKVYDATALLNIFWDLSTTDLITGAAYEYEPNSYHVRLEKESNK